MAQGRRAYPLHQFGGLRLDSAADEVGPASAIDILNVDFDSQAKIKTRPGYSISGASSNAYDWIFANPGAGMLFGRRGTTLARMTGVGSAEAATTTIAASSSTFRAPSAVNVGIMFAGAQAATTYIADGTNTLVGWSALFGFATTAGSPKGKYLAVQPNQNRLVVAGTADNGEPTGGGSASSGSHVWFSDPGAPGTWSANNYVILDPGDGEVIVEAVAWRELLFVFKQTKMYVFYGNSTDASGNPVFNYRTVQLGTYIADGTNTIGRKVVAGRDGVYFASTNGIYATSGAEPALISDALYPMKDPGGKPSFAASLPAFTSVSLFTNAGLYFNQNRLYVNVTDGSTAGVLVLDTHLGAWMFWQFDRTCTYIGSTFFSSVDYLLFGSSSNDIARLTGTTDNGTAVSWLYRTGFYNAGDDFNKRIPEAEVWGTGTVDYKFSVDFGSLGTAQTLTLGTSPAVAKATANKTLTGTLFSHQFSGSGQAVVHRCVQMIASERQPGTKL